MVDILTPGVLSSACVEGLKFLIRFVKKDKSFCFPTAFYLIAVPVLNVFTPFALFWLGVTTVDPGTTGLGVHALAVFVSSVVSVATNTLVINPTSDYAKLVQDRA